MITFMQYKKLKIKGVFNNSRLCVLENWVILEILLNCLFCRKSGGILESKQN